MAETASRALAVLCAVRLSATGSKHNRHSSNESAAVLGAATPGNPATLFYSFFVSMEKSAGYAVPFANKVQF